MASFLKELDHIGNMPLVSILPVFVRQRLVHLQNIKILSKSAVFHRTYKVLENKFLHAPPNEVEPFTNNI